MRYVSPMLLIAAGVLCAQQAPSPDVLKKAEEAAKAAVQQGKPATATNPPAQQLPFTVQAGTAPVSILAMPPTDVVATVDGRKVTAGELQTILRQLAPQVQQQALQNREELLRQLGFIRRLAGDAEKAKLDQTSPYKEMLEQNRLNLLAQWQLSEYFNTGIKVSAEEAKAYFEKNPERYQQARVKAIYIPFVATVPADAKDPKPLTEEQAKAKAEDVAKQARGGADFVKLVKEHSKDPNSAAKDGDFGVILKSTPIPEPVKQAIFNSKPGAVTDPVRQPNGFYIFRTEEITALPFTQVQNNITEELRNSKFNEWMVGLRKAIDIKMEPSISPVTVEVKPSAPAPAK